MAWPATTLNVTGIVIGLPVAVGAVMVTVPLYWPTARLPAFAEICMVPGVVPLAGVAASQGPPVAVAVPTVKFIGPGVPDTVTVCAAGADPPAACVKVRAAGVAETDPTGPAVT
jgi:hypothetical protein